MASEALVHPLTASGIGRLWFLYQNLESSLYIFLLPYVISDF